MSFDRSRRGLNTENVWTGSAWSGGAEPHQAETACLGTPVRGQSSDEAAGAGLAERLLRRRNPTFGMGQGIHMSEPCPPEGRIDLRPLLSHPDATEMLLLARGQLNRAFRQHGLCPPDPMPDCGRSGSDLDAAELDDPAAQGVERARARFREPFAAWAAAMPLDLAGPVLKILRQTHAALCHQPGNHQRGGGGAARAAVLIAHDFLLDHVNGD